MIKINADINSNGSWLMTFIAMNLYAWVHAVPFSEFWVPLSALFGWHSGRRLWRELKMPNGTVISNGEEVKT